MVFSRVIDSVRLSRARRIPDSDVSEFSVISSDPLKAYCYIRGSSQYVVAFDLEAGVVAHNCPDFVRKRRWCKHIGKLLLILPEATAHQAVSAHDQLEQVTGKGAVNRIVERLSMLEPEEPGRMEELLITETAELPDRISEETLVERIREVLEGDTYSVLFTIHTYLMKWGERTSSVITEHFQDQVDEVIHWVMSTLMTTKITVALDYTYLIGKIGEALGLNLNDLFAPLLKPTPAGTPLWKKTHLAYLNHQLKAHWSSHIIDFPNTEVELNPDMIRRILRLYQPRVDEVRTFLQQGNSRSGASLPVEDMLIYYIRSSGENPKLSIGRNPHNNVTYLPSKKLENLPACNFALRKLVGSGMNYVENSTLSEYQKFFAFLNGEKVNIDWMERRRTGSGGKLAQGIIIHWDINTAPLIPSTYIHGRKFMTVIPDKNSAFSRQLQPFDYTICDNAASPYRLEDGGTHGIYTHYPRQVLTAQQVVDAIYQGYHIESNLLPWHVLENYVHQGRISQGEVRTAVDLCKKHEFIYGSRLLREHLSRLEMYRRDGISSEGFAQISRKLKKDTGRLNIRTRPLLRKFIKSEWELDELSTLFDENQMLTLVHRCIRSTNSLEEVRTQICTAIANEVFGRPQKFREFLDISKRVPITSYAGINEELGKLIQKHYAKDLQSTT